MKKEDLKQQVTDKLANTEEDIVEAYNKGVSFVDAFLQSKWRYFYGVLILLRPVWFGLLLLFTSIFVLCVETKEEEKAVAKRLLKYSVFYILLHFVILIGFIVLVMTGTILFPDFIQITVK